MVGAAAHYAEVVSNWMPVSMLLYWLTLGAGYALEGAQRERAQALRTTELEGQLARSELAVLRAQLHPHFLFNALNTAVSLVRARQPEAGVHVLTHLSDLLRQLVAGVEQEVPLREELRLARQLPRDRARAIRKPAFHHRGCAPGAARCVRSGAGIAAARGERAAAWCGQA